jgi:hypothetical protein
VTCLCCYPAEQSLTLCGTVYLLLLSVYWPAQKMEMRGNKQAQRGRYQQAAQQAPDPAAVRAGTPPASVAAAAAAGAGKARAASRSPAPPGAAAIAAGGGKGGGQRGRSATPPTQGVPKRRGGAAAADGQAPQSKRPRGNKSPIDAAAAMAAVPTHQEIIQAASAQQMTLQDLVKMFKPRLVSAGPLLGHVGHSWPHSIHLYC